MVGVEGWLADAWWDCARVRGCVARVVDAPIVLGRSQLHERWGFALIMDFDDIPNLLCLPSPPVGKIRSYHLCGVYRRRLPSLAGMQKYLMWCPEERPIVGLRQGR
jgi:hypothetical protein